MPGQGSRCYLMVRAREWMCALPLEEVEETMRPLPISPVSSAPPFVRGVCLVRGSSAPVVNLGMLLGGERTPPGQRFVSVRVPEGRLALEVDEVRGVRWLDDSSLEAVPSLLRATAGGQLRHMGSVDGSLLAVLGSAQLLSAELWGHFEQPGAAKDGAGDGRGERA